MQKEQQKPSWLSDADKERCYATKSGWVISRKDGHEELIMSVRGLPVEYIKTELVENPVAPEWIQPEASVRVSDISFSGGAYIAKLTKQVRLHLDKKVTVSGHPTIRLVGSQAGDIQATYTSTGGGGNILVFTFTVPAAGNVLSVPEQHASVGDSDGILEADSGMAVDVHISSEVSSISPTKKTV
jgi:hypothetical protein